MKHRFRAAAVGVCVLLMALSGATAFAASPVTISDTVTDPDGWLSADQSARISSAASSARAKGLDIYFVAVPDFSGKNMGDWCKQSIKQSGLSTASIAYVIAYEERKHVSCGNAGEPVVSNSQLTTARSAAETALRAADPLTAEATTDAALAFYSSVESSASGAGSSASPSPARTSAASSGKDTATTITLRYVAFFVGVTMVYLIARRTLGRGKKSVANATTRDAERARRLVDEANRQLLSADEQVRSADDELSFAQAQFGALKTQEYGAALQAARNAVAQCFVLQQQMNAAANALDTARRAMAMASHQMDAIFAAKNDLSAIEDTLTRAIASITSDLSDVTRLGADQVAFAPLVADAHTAVDKAQSARSGIGDPLIALEELRTAEATLDAALEPLRSEEDAEKRRRTSASQRIAEAETLLEQADRYVQGRRGAIDLDTRSQLAQAHSALSEARAATESAEAASHAATAATLARQVLAAPATPSFNTGTAPTFNTGTPRSRGNGSFTGSTLGDFLMWMTAYGVSQHGWGGGHGTRDRYDSDSSWDRDSYSDSSGSSDSSSSSSDSDMGWGGSSF